MRNRLTARNVKAESQEDGLFPGDIGNEERARSYHAPDEYSNYDWQPGWDVPDPNAPAIKDERDEVGFGIPKTVDVYQTAKQAAILAQLYLGDDAPDEAIEDQARDFLKLGHRRIVSSIRRWKATEPTPEKEAPESAPTEGTPVTAEAAPAPAPTPAPEAPATAEPEAKASEEAPAEPPPTEDPNIDELTANEEAPEMELEIAAAADEVDGGAMFAADGELNQAEADPELVSFFSDEDPKADDNTVARCASKKASKQGIKHLAGQPKLASSDAAGLNELANIWTNLKSPGL